MKTRRHGRAGCAIACSGRGHALAARSARARACGSHGFPVSRGGRYCLSTAAMITSLGSTISVTWILPTSEYASSSDRPVLVPGDQWFRWSWHPRSPAATNHDSCCRPSFSHGARRSLRRRCGDFHGSFVVTHQVANSRGHKMAQSTVIVRPVNDAPAYYGDAAEVSRHCYGAGQQTVLGLFLACLAWLDRTAWFRPRAPTTSPAAPPADVTS